MYILPGATPGPIPDTEVNGTPIAAIPDMPIATNGSSLSFDNALRQAWFRQVETRVKGQGYKGIAIASTQEQAADPWAVACSVEDPTSQIYM